MIPESLNKPFLLALTIWAIAGALLLLAFDQWQLFLSVNTRHTPGLDQLMYRLTWMGEPEVIVPALATLMVLPRFRSWRYVGAALACNILPSVIVQAVKQVAAARRPLCYLSDQPGIHCEDSWAHLYSYSFPSGHTTAAFAFFCFLALQLQSGYKGFGWLMFFLALLTAYSRIYLAAHFFADIYAGSLIGSITAMGLHLAFTRKGRSYS